MRRRIAAASRTTFRSLQYRNFRLFFIGQLISQVGTWLTMIALTLLVLHRTHSGLDIGALVACQYGPMLLFGAFGGLVADRSDKRRLLITTQTLEMLQSFALGGLAFMHHAPLIAFYLTALAGGCMLAFDNPARRSFVTEMVPENEVQNAATLNSAIMTSARIFGPALGGFLVVTTGYPWAFTIDAISYLAVIVALRQMRTEELRPSPRTERARGQIREGLRYLRAVPDLWVPMVMMTIVGTLTFNFSVVLPLFAERTLHGSDTTFTLLFSVLSVGSFAGALAASYRRAISVRHVAMTAVAFGVGMFVLSAMPNIASAFPAALLVGCASVGFMASSTAVVQIRARPDMRGRVLAIQAMVFIGSTPIGGPLIGAICDRFGARAGLVVGATAAVAAGSWGWAALRRAPEATTSRAASPVDGATFAPGG